MSVLVPCNTLVIGLNPSKDGFKLIFDIKLIYLNVLQDICRIVAKAEKISGVTLR